MHHRSCKHPNVVVIFTANRTHQKQWHQEESVQMVLDNAVPSQRYITRKDTILKKDNRRKEYAWCGSPSDKRDVMPDCVLKIVRHWYPNPSGKPYMGHKWQ